VVLEPPPLRPEFGEEGEDPLDDGLRPVRIQFIGCGGKIGGWVNE
jgi:hypothetical protein